MAESYPITSTDAANFGFFSTSSLTSQPPSDTTNLTPAVAEFCFSTLLRVYKTQSACNIQHFASVMRFGGKTVYEVKIKQLWKDNLAMYNLVNALQITQILVANQYTSER